MRSVTRAALPGVLLAGLLGTGTSGAMTLPDRAAVVTTQHRDPGSGSGRMETTAVVDRVIDGDTIVIKSHGARTRIRLIGVNTPESVHPTKPVECYGKEASTHTAKILPPGTALHLKRDVELRDRYGRMLAYVYRAKDALLVNLELVLDGFGRAYRFPPNVRLSEQFSQAQAHASAAGLGLWSKCKEEPQRR